MEGIYQDTKEPIAAMRVRIKLAGSYLDYGKYQNAQRMLTEASGLIAEDMKRQRPPEGRYWPVRVQMEFAIAQAQYFQYQGRYGEALKFSQQALSKGVELAASHDRYVSPWLANFSRSNHANAAVSHAMIQMQMGTTSDAEESLRSALDPSDNQYRIIGNQYRYPGGVSPYAQRREFPKDAAYTYDSVGYVFDLPCNSYTKNWVKVVITTPPYNDAGDQGQITMKPNVTGGICNYSYFTVSKDAINPSGTGFIRIQSKFSGTPPVAHPRDKEGTFLVFTDEDMTDAQVEKLPQFGTWKYEYFFAGNNSSSPDTYQYYKTTARAKTVDGFKKSVPLPNLTSIPASVGYQPQGSLTLVQHPSIGYFIPQGNKVDLTWSVASDVNPLLKGSEPATYRARIYGSYGNAAQFSGGKWLRLGYEDSVQFRTSARSSSIYCGEGASAPQCVNGNFKNTSYETTVTDIDLISRTSDAWDASHFYTFRKYSN
jgi:hypothetical protein